MLWQFRGLIERIKYIFVKSNWNSQICVGCKIVNDVFFEIVPVIVNEVFKYVGV